MKRMAIFAMFLVTLVGITQAGVAAAAENKKAILFDFGGLWLDNFDSNFGVGMRYWMNEGTALRPAVGFRFRTDKNEQEKPTTTDTEDKQTYTNIDFSLAIEKHMKAGEKVSPYIGVGAGIGMGTQKHEPSNAVPLTAGDLTEEKWTNTNFSGFGLLGVDWSFTDNLSLGGEYRLGANFGTSKYENTHFSAPAADVENKTTSTDFSTSTGQLYVSFSF